MNNEKNKFLTVSWLIGLLSAEIFISTGEWGVQMPPLTSENSHFLWSGPQEATVVMWHYFNLVKRVKFGVSGHFPENAWREWPEIWHADVSWPSSELISFWPLSVDFSNFSAILT